MDGRLTWTDCGEAGDYVVPNVLSPRDLVSRTDNMDETVPHTDTPLNPINETGPSLVIFLKNQFYVLRFFFSSGI